jgi:hypothetical protein
MARFLGSRGRTAEAIRQIVVVARTHASLFEHLRRAFAGNPTVQVVMDRRAGDRRRQPNGHLPDRRLVDRRLRRDVEGALRTRGWTIVRLR